MSIDHAYLYRRSELSRARSKNKSIASLLLSHWFRRSTQRWRFAQFVSRSPLRSRGQNGICNGAIFARCVTWGSSRFIYLSANASNHLRACLVSSLSVPFLPRAQLKLTTLSFETSVMSNSVPVLPRVQLRLTTLSIITSQMSNSIQVSPFCMFRD